MKWKFSEPERRNQMFDTEMRESWGWRGVLGFISPAVVLSYGAEYSYKFGLLGVGMMEVTLGLVNATDDNMNKVLPGLDNAAKTLADQGAQFVCLGGPPATLVDGHDHNLKIKKRLEEITKVPSTTALLATIDAFNSLSVNKIVIVEPGSSDGQDIWVQRMKKYFENNGFKVVNTKSAYSKTTTLGKARLPMNLPYDLAKEAMLETPEAEGIYIACGVWGGPPVAHKLETEFGKPVVFDDANCFWAGLKALNIKLPVKGLGRLFETL
jgi:maleate cis-trans isomerase